MSGSYGFVVVANRLPVDEHTETGDEHSWTISAGGLVSALHPVVRKAEGAWLGSAENAGEDLETFTFDGMSLHPLSLSAAEIDEYYEGESNATIWPLFHDAVEQPEYRQQWWQTYQNVNHRFAQAAAQIAAPDATVWVHDYQLMLVPGMLRALRPDLRIGFFLHIPFPPVELFMQLPGRDRIISGLLGADLVGFQRPLAAHNFLQLTAHLLGLEPAADEVAYEDRTVIARAFPISIDTAAFAHRAADPSVLARAAQIKEELGSRRLLLGVDRLDYTKGIEQRLGAYGELLADGALRNEDVVLVQVAIPTRQRVLQYQQLRERVEAEVGRISGQFGHVGRTPVHYLRQSVDPDELAALYLAADVMVVTPLRDGMNLVAKEFVATRVDDGGALVLSEFTGAAAELTDAFLVNPHDSEDLKRGILEALTTEPGDLTARMRRMRAHVQAHDVDRWAQDFLDTLNPKR